MPAEPAVSARLLLCGLLNRPEPHAGKNGLGVSRADAKEQDVYDGFSVGGPVEALASLSWRRRADVSHLQDAVAVPVDNSLPGCAKMDSWLPFVKGDSKRGRRITHRSAPEPRQALGQVRFVRRIESGLDADSPGAGASRKRSVTLSRRDPTDMCLPRLTITHHLHMPTYKCTFAFETRAELTEEEKKHLASVLTKGYFPDVLRKTAPVQDVEATPHGIRKTKGADLATTNA